VRLVWRGVGLLRPIPPQGSKRARRPRWPAIPPERSSHAINLLPTPAGLELRGVSKVPGVRVTKLRGVFKLRGVSIQTKESADGMRLNSFQ
jgi:hypothetical protein